MGYRKQVLAAGIVQEILFPSMGDLDLYLASLDGKKIRYECLDAAERDDGSVKLRIVKQYNGSDLIRFYWI